MQNVINVLGNLQLVTLWSINDNNDNSNNVWCLFSASFDHRKTLSALLTMFTLLMVVLMVFGKRDENGRGGGRSGRRKRESGGGGYGGGRGVCVGDKINSLMPAYKCRQYSI